MSEWDRKYQNKMIPMDNLGLEIMAGHIRLLRMCVRQWQQFEKDYRNESRREQIMSLAEECGHTDLYIQKLTTLFFFRFKKWSKKMRTLTNSLFCDLFI